MKKFSYPLFIILLFVTCNTQAQLMKAKEIFSKADSLRGTLTPLRTCYDITYYHLDVKVDIDNRFISGSNLFQFKSTNTALYDLEKGKGSPW